MSQFVNELMNHKGACRTAPATQGLLIKCNIMFTNDLLDQVI